MCEQQLRAWVDTLQRIRFCDILLTNQFRKGSYWSFKNQWFCGRSRLWHVWHPNLRTCDALQEPLNTDDLESQGAHKRSSSPPWHYKSECCSTGSFDERIRSHHWIPSFDLGNLADRIYGFGEIPHFAEKQLSFKFKVCNVGVSSPGGLMFHWVCLKHICLVVSNELGDTN